MHIAFVNPQGNFDPAGSYLTAHPDFGGQLVYVREVALALAAMGHRCDILTRQVLDPEWPEFATPEDSYPQRPGVRVLRLPCGPPNFLPKEQLWPHLREWVGRIAELYTREGRWPDLWTGHYADGGLCSALLSERSGVPFTFTGHSLGAWKLDRLLPLGDDEAVACSLGELDDRFNFGARITAERASLARAATIITNTSSERYEQYRHPAYRDVVDISDDQRFAIIPPGVDLAIFDAAATSTGEEEIREAIQTALARDIAPERRELPAVIAWSRLDPMKNHIALVRAFSGESGLRHRSNLLMITRGLDDPLRSPDAASKGERSVLQPVVDEIERAGLWGTVSAFSLEGQEAAAALYRWGAEKGSVFCLPAKHEPFGLTLIEAMAAGLPVVATSNGGPREITAGGRAGLLAEPEDPAQLANQLLRLIGEPEAWHSYANRARERVLEHYTWRHAAEAYAQLGEEIARGERFSGSNTFQFPAFTQEVGTDTLPRLERWRRAGKHR